MRGSNSELAIQGAPWRVLPAELQAEMLPFWTQRLTILSVQSNLGT